MALISVSSVSDFKQNYSNMMSFFTVVENDLYGDKDFSRKLYNGKDFHRTFLTVVIKIIQPLLQIR